MSFSRRISKRYDDWLNNENWLDNRSMIAFIVVMIPALILIIGIGLLK